MTSSDVNTLTRQKELLLQKLSTFEETNRTLRDLLKEQHNREVSSAACFTFPDLQETAWASGLRPELGVRTPEL